MAEPHLIPGFIGAPDSLAARAYRFANMAHWGVRRKVDGNPFINHPCRVAAYAHRCDEDETLVAAGFLHDVVEDTGFELDAIRERFGDAVADLVDAVSEDKSEADYDTRKHGHLEKMRAFGPRAAVLFCADKLANLKDLVVSYEVEGETLGVRFNAPLDAQVEHMEAKIRFLFVMLPGGHPLLDELVAEHERFVGLRATQLARTA